MNAQLHQYKNSSDVKEKGGGGGDMAVNFCLRSSHCLHHGHVPHAHLARCGPLYTNAKGAERK